MASSVWPVPGLGLDPPFREGGERDAAEPGVLVEVGGHVLEQGVEDLVAVGEEAVQGGDGHPGTFGDGRLHV